MRLSLSAGTLEQFATVDGVLEMKNAEAFLVRLGHWLAVAPVVVMTFCCDGGADSNSGNSVISSGSGGAPSTGASSPNYDASSGGANDVDASPPHGGASNNCSPSNGEPACGAPFACGSFVVGTASLDAAPAAQGGILNDGVYQLVQAEVFRAQSWVATLRGVKVVSQGHLSSTIAEVENSSVSMSSGSYSVSGTALTWNIDCPTAGTSTYSYTATGNNLVLFEPAGTTSSIVTTYLRTQ